MRLISARKALVPTLWPTLCAVALLAGAGAAEAQAGKPPARPASSAMSPYATTVTPQSAAKGVGEGLDPLEPLNRKIFAFNQALDRVFIRPLATFWHHAAPRPLRLGINNFLSNLGEPVVFVNDVLQGRPATAVGTAARFLGNSTVGLLGVLDVTGPQGLPHHDNGFGLTLGRWGVKSGPYLYLPVLGPSTLRDGVGQGVDVLANPLTYARNTGSGGLTAGLGIAGGLDARAEADSDLKALQALSTDQYAALRSFYLQNRQAQITGGKIDLNALPDFDDPAAPGAPGAPAAPAAPAAGPTSTPAAPGSVSPTPQTLETPPAATPGVPQGDAAAIPHPATPAEPATATPPPAEPKGV